MAANMAEMAAAMAAKYVPCVICCESVDVANSVHFACGRDAAHVLCVACFGNHVVHACDNYLTGGIPVKCALPKCGFEIPDPTLRTLLAHPTNSPRRIYDLYADAQFRVGLMASRDDVPISCRKCNKSTVLFPANYKLRVERLAAHNAAHRPVVVTVGVSGKSNDAKDSKTAPAVVAGKPVVPYTNSTHASFDAKTSAAAVSAQTKLSPTDKDWWLPIPKKAPAAPVVPAAGTTTPATTTTPPMGDAKAAPATPAPVAGAPPPAVVGIQNAAAAAAALAGAPPLPPGSMNGLAPPAIRRQISDGMLTSFYYNCETPACGYSTCLRCDMLMTTPDTADHVCEIDKMEVLYQQLLRILADASVVPCPKCKFPGQKDDACCHMNCPGCKQRYCYMCGYMDDDFSQHNDSWRPWLEAPPQYCPMYTNYRWGDDNNSDYDGGWCRQGEEAKTLERFHIDRQRKAVDAHRALLVAAVAAAKASKSATTTAATGKAAPAAAAAPIASAVPIASAAPATAAPATAAAVTDAKSATAHDDVKLWDDMILARFPNGIWDASELEAMDRITADLMNSADAIAYREQKEKDKKKAEEEEAKKKAAAAATATAPAAPAAAAPAKS